MTENDKLDTEGDVIDNATDDNENVTDNDEVDPTEAAISAGVAAKLEELRLQADRDANQRFEERLEAERRATQEAEQNTQLINSFGTTVRELRDNLKTIKFTNDDGDEVTISDSDFERLIAQPLQRYNLKGEQASSLKVLTSLGEIATKSLPESLQSEFVKRASNKPLDKWLDEYAEIRAETTGYAKKLKAETEAAVKAAEARGFKKGQGQGAAPPGQSDSGKPNSNATVDRNSLAGAARALSQGLITEDEYRDINKKLRG